MTSQSETFGRLPTPLYERCFRLYREVLSSFRIVFQPVVTIGPAVASGNFSDLWVYLVGPPLGGIVAGLLYKTVFEEEKHRKR